MWFADHYHSQVHTDKDMFLTYLGVLSDTDDVENADDIVHLFVFPECVYPPTSARAPTPPPVPLEKFSRNQLVAWPGVCAHDVGRYRVYVEMRSGDTLLFNPCEAHGCSEGLVESPWIFSCYLSTSTAVSQAGVRVGVEAKAENE